MAHLTLHNDLLDQALFLAGITPVKQVNLRRSISSAYYAIFHLLTCSATELVSGNLSEPVKLQLRRAFNHTDMVGVCKKFKGTGDTDDDPPQGDEDSISDKKKGRSAKKNAEKQLAVNGGEKENETKDAVKIKPVGFSPPLDSLLECHPSKELRKVAKAFVTLQENRHKADYDMTVVFSEADVDVLLQTASLAFELWPSVKDTENGKVFLTALLMQKLWSRAA